MIVEQGFQDFAKACGQAFYVENASTISYFSGIPFPPANGFFEKGERQLSTEEIQEAIARMSGMPFFGWANNKILEDYGFVYGGHLCSCIVVQDPCFTIDVYFHSD